MPESPFASPPESLPPAKGGGNSRDEFELLWPLIPGAFFTLIGVGFLLCDKNKVHGVVVCYVGLMALIVAGGIIWRQCIPRQYQQFPPDPNAEKRHELGEASVLLRK